MALILDIKVMDGGDLGQSWICNTGQGLCQYPGSEQTRGLMPWTMVGEKDKNPLSLSSSCDMFGIPSLLNREVICLTNMKQIH